jgi:hypothetical protein
MRDGDLPGRRQRLLQEPELGGTMRCDRYPQSGARPPDHNDEGSEALCPGGERPGGLGRVPVSSVTVQPVDAHSTPMSASDRYKVSYRTKRKNDLIIVRFMPVS